VHARGAEVRAHVWAAKIDRRYAPLFATIGTTRRHSADVRTGANAQVNDEKEGLGVEQYHDGLQPKTQQSPSPQFFLR
jgi:hypothetical protein